MMIPQVPNHDGSPQSGRAYQPCDPGPIGKLLSVSSTFGVEQFPTCTFVGEEGVADFSPNGGLRGVRFADAPYLLEVPVYISDVPSHSMSSWRFLNAQWQSVFATTEREHGAAATLAHAKHWVPRLLDQIKGQPPLKMWCAQPRYIALSPDAVEVQQLYRRDTVRPKDLKVTREGGDLVLKADAFYEARFIGGETPNIAILMLLLKMLAS